MSAPTSQIFSVRYTFDQTEGGNLSTVVVTHLGVRWSCELNAHGSDDIKNEAVQWCSENIDPGMYWVSQNDTRGPIFVNLYDEEDVVAFKLRWEGVKCR